MSTAVDDLLQLSALNKRFIQNFISNNVPGHDAILHPDFIAIQPSGAYQDRVSYLRGWATGFNPKVLTYYDMRDERITLIPGFALVRATTKRIREVDGKPVTSMTRYTDTYVRGVSGWVCIQAQLTPMADESNFPPDSTIVCAYHHGVLQQPS